LKKIFTTLSILATLFIFTFAIAKPDFRNMKDVSVKKKSFINYMLKGIDKANSKICSERKTIELIQKDYDKNGNISSSQAKDLKTISDLYKVNDKSPIKEQLDQLSLRVDTLPKSFVLAQAILESGWGTSRFAVEHNNYFGLHCFDNGCGAKAMYANVYMEDFNDVSDSVFGYYYRLNTGTAFKKLRVIRKQDRDDKNFLNQLLDTLGSYSELGDKVYKSRLLNVIDYNNLKQYDGHNCI